MDWIRENKPLAIILGVIAAASAALGYLLFDAWSTYTASKETYVATNAQIAQLNSMRLAPTEANLQAKKAQVEDFAANVNKLGAALLILQPPLAPTKDIEFQAKLKAKVADIRKQSATFKTALPADFAFGFDDYTSSLPKSEAAATELSGYLDAVEELVKLCMKSGVESVDSLDRTKLAVEGAAATAAQGQQQQRNVRGAQQASPGDALLEKRSINLVLTLDQGALQLLTSRLANPSEMPYFTTLRLLRVENQRQEGPPRSEAVVPTEGALQPSATTDASGNPVAAESASSNEIRPPAPAPVDSIPLIGQEKLKVRMEIDLVKFLDAVRGIAQQGSAAPVR